MWGVWGRGGVVGAWGERGRVEYGAGASSTISYLTKVAASVEAGGRSIAGISKFLDWCGWSECGGGILEREGRRVPKIMERWEWERFLGREDRTLGLSKNWIWPKQLFGVHSRVSYCQYL